MTSTSLLSYYRDYQINPVPIGIDHPDAWHSHVAKRRNLYEKHLGVPLGLLRQRSVLEFGCNSGENALVLAHFGATLTLVEPNDQVFPRLQSLFSRFGLEHRVARLTPQCIHDFESTEQYDVVIAEGFLNHLAGRDDAVRKLLGFVAPDGIAILSFDCRYGHFLEMTRKYLFWRACRLAAIDDLHSTAALDIARRLYLEDFGRLNASRPFAAWWQDVLLNPFVSWEHLWSYPELIEIIEAAGCEFLSSSPRWSSVDAFSWHKNVPDAGGRHRALVEEWYTHLTFFLTGLRSSTGAAEPAPPEVAEAVSNLIADISDYISGPDAAVERVQYPSALSDYLSHSQDPRIPRVDVQLRHLYEVARTGRVEDVLAAYQMAEDIRHLWGAPYHYMSITRPA